MVISPFFVETNDVGHHCQSNINFNNCNGNDGHDEDEKDDDNDHHSKEKILVTAMLMK